MVSITNSILRVAVPGDEAGIHDAHMRSIREVCSRDHGAEEIRGWGHRELGDRWRSNILRNQIDEWIWVVEKDGRIEGYVFSRLQTDHVMYLGGLYLTPSILGQGWGQKLMDLTQQAARNAGVTRIVLQSTLTAHEFYLRRGFKDTGPLQWTEIAGYPVRNIPMTLSISERSD